MGVGGFGCHESVPPPKQNFVAAPLTVPKEITKVTSVIASSFIVMNIVMLFSLLSELSYV